MRSVVITGIGIVSALGNSLSEVAGNLALGTSKIRLLDGKLSGWAGGVAECDGSTRFSKAELSILDRTSVLALWAAQDAVAGSGIEPAALSEGGVYVGCGSGGAPALDETYRSILEKGYAKGTSLVKIMANAPAAHLSIRFGIRGPNQTYAVSCSSSALAIGEAYRAIRDGYLDVALAGGVEAPLTEGMIKSWEAMRILARPAGEDGRATCRPFCKTRSGLVLGEGAVFYIIETAESAKKRGADIYAELVGYGGAADASHITAPSSEGQARSMRAAMRNAQIAISDVRYVNAHGTATVNGDISEAQAICSVFGEHADDVFVSSTKSAHGHLIGGAGALELIPAILAVKDGLMSPTINHVEDDPECELNLIKNKAITDHSVRYAMSNSFAFGGSNASLIVKRWE